MMPTLYLYSWLVLCLVFIGVASLASMPARASAVPELRGVVDQRQLVSVPNKQAKARQDSLLGVITAQLQAEPNFDQVQISLQPLGNMPALLAAQAQVLTLGIRSRIAVRVRGVDAQSGRMRELTVWFAVQALHEAWVYDRDGRADQPLATTTPRRQRVDIARLQVPVAALAEHLGELWLSEDVSAGSVVLRRQLKQEPLVWRNTSVKVVVSGRGLVVQTQGKALRSGAMGDVLPIQLEGTQANVTARVAGKGVLHVDL